MADEQLGKGACARLLEERGEFPGWRSIKVETFVNETGIPCAEISGYNELNKEYGKPVAAEWSIREFGDRFFPDSDVDLDRD